MRTRADDYIAKPFRMRELLARVGAALRRPGLGNERALLRPAARVTAGDLVLDPSNYTVRRAERLLTLKPRAFALLLFFMQHPSQVFSREQLLAQLWDNPCMGDARTVDVLMMGPGGYTFNDFLRVGLGMALVCFLTLLLVMRLFWAL
jgi:DNA-binding response OmpR family regulator